MTGGARAALLLGVLTASALTASTAVQANGEAKRCRPDGARLQAANDRVEVFWRSRGRALYACRRDRRGSVRLSPRGSATYPRPGVTVRGYLVAYGVEVDDGTTVFRRVVVQDVRRPRSRLLNLPAYGYVANIVLRDGGRLAWMACAGGTNAIEPKPRCRFTPEGAVAVYKHDAGSPARDAERLDEGAGVAVGSLRLDGRTVSWRHGDAEHTHELE